MLNMGTGGGALRRRALSQGYVHRRIIVITRPQSASAPGTHDDVCTTAQPTHPSRCRERTIGRKDGVAPHHRDGGDDAMAIEAPRPRAEMSSRDQRSRGARRGGAKRCLLPEGAAARPSRRGVQAGIGMMVKSVRRSRRPVPRGSGAQLPRGAVGAGFLGHRRDHRKNTERTRPADAREIADMVRASLALEHSRVPCPGPAQRTGARGVLRH